MRHQNLDFYSVVVLMTATLFLCTKKSRIFHPRFSTGAFKHSPISFGSIINVGVSNK